MASRTSWVIAALLVGIEIALLGCGSVTKTSGEEGGGSHVLNPVSGVDQIAPIPTVPSLGMMANFKNQGSTEQVNYADEKHAAAVITQDAKQLLDQGCNLFDGNTKLEYSLFSQPADAAEPTYLLGFDVDPLRSITFACPDGSSALLPRTEGFSEKSVSAKVLVSLLRPIGNVTPSTYKILLRLDPAYDWTDFFAIRYEDGEIPQITTARPDSTFVLGNYPAGVPLTDAAFTVWVKDHIRVGDLQTHQLVQIFFSNIHLNITTELGDTLVNAGTFP